MKLIFTGHDCRYAVEQSLLAFFPNERPVYEGEDENTAKVALTEESGGARAVTELWADGKSARGEARTDIPEAADEYERERLRQRAVKLSFFHAARSLTGITPAWGALPGALQGQPPPLGGDEVGLLQRPLRLRKAPPLLQQPRQIGRAHV